jgi:hypothetical protein
MKSGLYVLVPVGLADRGEKLSDPVPLVDGVVFRSFESSWKAEVRRFLEGFQKEYSAFSDSDLKEFDKARYCLVRRFADFGGGRPISPAVYDRVELDIRRRVRRTYGLARAWLQSFAVLALAGRIHFACFRWWFGLQIPAPPGEAACYHGEEVGWYGRWVPGQEGESPTEEYWARVRRILDNLTACRDESRPAIAADTFARAIFADDWRVEMLCLWIALEALFGQADTELSHQLCERAAAFTEPPGQDRHRLYRELKSAYSFRSKLVHGSLADLAGQQKKRLSAAIDLVEDTVRNALQNILADAEMTERFSRRQGLNDYLEQAVLAPPCASEA